MRKTKVLLLLHELSRSGAPKSGLEVFEAMRDSTEVRIISLLGGPLEETASRLGPLKVLEHGWKLRGWRWHYHHRFHDKKWLREINRWSPDLIYVNGVGSLPIASAVPLPGVPVILHVREMRSVLEIVMAEKPDLMTLWPSRYIAVSGAVAQDLRKTCGIDPGRITVIPVFVTERNFQELDSSAEFGKDDRFVVGGCGDPMEWRKGPMLWLQMAAELRRLIGETARFVWVGVQKQPELCPLRNQARALGVAEAIEFVPATSTPLAHFSRFDIFALTSLEDSCPRVVLESMRLGKPVACFSRSGGAREEVGDPGLILDDFCPREMARRIAELASRPEERARLGALARERVRLHFTDRVQVPRIRSELDHVLQKESGGAETSADRQGSRPAEVAVEQ
jgi:glycosyltransferase involved in cell wall biosynthesis